MREEVQSDTDGTSFEKPESQSVSIVEQGWKGLGEESGGSKRQGMVDVRHVMVVLQSIFASQWSCKHDGRARGPPSRAKQIKAPDW